MNNKELIDSEEFEKALNEGAECKRNMSVSYKTQNKQNFKRFEEVMYEANEQVKKILETKKKSRTESDNKLLHDFKSDIKAMYSQMQALSVREKLEDGQKTRIEKIADKIMPVLLMLNYVNGDSNDLEKAFEAKGLKLCLDKKLEDMYPILANESKKTVLKDIFANATAIKQKIQDDNERINTDIYMTKVPADLQYDKKANNAGLKTSDFRKLVDMKAKLIAATTQEAKDKADEKIEHVASEKQFEVARAELVRDKLTSM